ncbi:MAG TPA: sigma-70 family RNA polymerase sigma factor [Polyangia bacterium]
MSAGVIFGPVVLTDEQPDSAINTAIATLIGRAQAGDATAFARLVGRYEDRVFATAFGLLRDRDDALDAVQETFVRLYKYLDRYDPAGDLGAWIYRISVNVSLRLAKRRRRDRSAPTISVAGEGGDPEAAVISRDLGRALETLTETERMALVLRDFEGLETDEVARLLSSSPTTVRVHICAARKKIRRFLDGDPNPPKSLDESPR